LNSDKAQKHQTATCLKTVWNQRGRYDKRLKPSL
jgi:hypothetical protein